MAFPDIVTSSLQVFAAFAVFIAGYFALIVCAILCVVIAQLYSDRHHAAPAYAVRSNPLGVAAIAANTASRRAARPQIKSAR
jgi:hypothetical protein